jgi:molybdopterin converting factor small subunit
MQIHVDTYANLRQYSPAGEGSFDLTLSPGATVRSIIEALRIPRSVNMVILVNGRRAAEDTRLNAADEITLFPPIEGG